MIMADILFWIAIAIGVLATLIAHWLAAQALLPNTVARCHWFSFCSVRSIRFPFRSPKSS
jgi:cbb3-type cytochrome oxidase subunit 1